MAVSLLDSTTTGNTAFASSRAVPVPTGGGALAANDVVVVRLSRWESTNPAVTAPAGFIARTQVVSGSSKLNTYLKRLIAGDSGTYSFSWTGSMWTTGQAKAYRGVDPAADLATIPLHQLTGSGAVWPALTLNGVSAGALDWHGYSENGGAHTPPTSFTEVEDNDSDCTAYRIVAAGNYTTAAGTSVSSNLIASMIHLPEASAGGSEVTGSGSATLVAPTATASGLRSGQGSGAATLPTVTASAAGLRAGSGSGAATLPPAVAALAGLREGHGSGTATLPGVVAAGAAAVTVPGSATASLPPLSATAAGLREAHGSGAAVLPSPIGHLTGTGTEPLAVVVLPAVLATAIGTRETVGIASATLAGPLAVANGLRDGHGSGAAVLPQLAATLTVETDGGEEAPPPEEDGLTLEDLMDARATHESIMLDTISIRHPGMVEQPFDPGLGYAPATPREPYYTGKATVQARQIQASQTEPAGLGTLTQLGYAVKIPVTVIECAPEDIVTVHESAEPAHDGIEIMIRNVESNTFATARRMTGVRYEPSTP